MIIINLLIIYGACHHEHFGKCGLLMPPLLNCFFKHVCAITETEQ